MTGSTDSSQPSSTKKWLAIAVLLLLLLGAACWWLYQRSKIPGTVRLDLRNVATPWKWRLVEDAHLEQVVSAQEGSQAIMAVAPGDYKLQISELAVEGEWITWPQRLTVRPGTQLKVTVDSSLRLNIPDQLGSPWRWRVIHANASQDVIEWLSGDHRVAAVPPGEYQVQVSESSLEGNWVTWPEKIQVQSGQQSTMTIDSSLKVEIPPEFGTPWRWRVVPFGNPDEVVQWRDGNHLTALLPPGEYEIEVSQSSLGGNWVRWPQRLNVQAHAQTTATVDSGIRLNLPAGQTLWRWSVATTTAPAQTIQWLSGGNLLMLVPPGEYSVKIRPSSDVAEKTVSESVAVPQGRIAEVRSQ